MKINTKDRVDWFRVFWDLKFSGVTLEELGKHTQIPRTSLRMYENGSEPPHCRGQRIVAFWCQALGKKEEELPKTFVESRRENRRKKFRFKPIVFDAV